MSSQKGTGAGIRGALESGVGESVVGTWCLGWAGGS